MGFPFNWQSLADQARALEPDHRTPARETILVSSDPQKVAGASPLQSVPGASRSEDADTDLTNLIDTLRRAIRLQGCAVATEETCVYWNRRFIRFYFQKLGQAPKVAGASRSSPLSGRLARI